MKKYFYTNGTENFGPFTLEELKQEHISRGTPVWFQELGEWKEAGSVPEISEIFKLAPPVIPKPTPNIDYNQHANTQQPPKTWLLESILVTLFCCIPFGIAGIVNASKVESRFASGDIAGATQASNDAAKWTKISFWVGLITSIIAVVVSVARDI